jgi:hypothetical protein
LLPFVLVDGDGDGVAEGDFVGLVLVGDAVLWPGGVGFDVGRPLGPALGVPLGVPLGEALGPLGVALGVAFGDALADAPEDPDVVETPWCPKVVCPCVWPVAGVDVGEAAAAGPARITELATMAPALACVAAASAPWEAARKGLDPSHDSGPIASRSRGADTLSIARTTRGSNCVPEQLASSRRAASRPIDLR